MTEELEQDATLGFKVILYLLGLAAVALIGTGLYIAPVTVFSVLIGAWAAIILGKIAADHTI